MGTPWMTISIPPRLRGEMLTKEAFEVPFGPDGEALITWWEKAASTDRDAIMKLAYDKNINIAQALKQHLQDKLLDTPTHSW